MDLVRVGAIYNVASVGWSTGDKEFHFTQIEEIAVYRNWFPGSAQTGQISLRLDPNFCTPLNVHTQPKNYLDRRHWWSYSRNKSPHKFSWQNISLRIYLEEVAKGRRRQKGEVERQESREEGEDAKQKRKGQPHSFSWLLLQSPPPPLIYFIRILFGKC